MAIWSTKLDPNPGLTVAEIMDAIHDEKLHGMYIMGENPAMSDPDLNEAAANMLTNPALDPFGKIPEFKYCAIRVTTGGQVAPVSSYGGGQILATS